MKFWKRAFCWAMLGALCLPLWGCATAQAGEAVDYMKEITPAPPAARKRNPEARADFAVRLLKSSRESGTCVIAPDTVYRVLAMLANGAAGETRAQMEAFLGGQIRDINRSAAETPGPEALTYNALWLNQKEHFEVREDFLQTNADFWGAEIFGAPFSEETRKDINRRVAAATKDRIPELLDSLDPAAALYLISALAFDAEWETPFREDQIYEGIFRGAAGEESALMMESRENLYLEDGSTTGFLKNYRGGRYCFLALLPGEGMTVEEYIETLTGERLLETVRSAQEEPVRITLPKFEAETSLELSPALSGLGMDLAFSDDADFSGISDTELRIGRILHQTRLKVDELGTKAGAAAAAEVVFKCALLHEKTVTLDRPFLMGVFDREQEDFLFLGAIDSVG